ncbi:MAG: Glutamyl-tRNA(Gln) amidotransferase subunit [Pseudomonadota bacterium]|jgi:aspartyl-tRNA(Asn)/glutamyl-tRNA(Gln) amidotransferase subunit A
MSDIASLTISDMRAGLDSKQFSCTELVKASLDTADSYSGLNCFNLISAENALKEAAHIDELLAQGKSAPLLGIPVGIKDVICTKGVRTTASSKILENFIPPYDATVVRKLKTAGTVSIGKLNMDEFAMGSSNENSAFGPVKNPWNPEYVPGGSSGGSAAAVAAGICPITLGTDTGGSIRQPASFCGIVGLKPTYGRVSRYGVIAYASSLDQVGGFARNVKDCALVTQAICGQDPNDATSAQREVPDFTKSLGQSIKGLRIGLPKEYFVSAVDGEIDAALKKAISVLEGLGAIPVEISLPHTDAAVAVYYILAPAEASSNLARYDGIRYGHRAKGNYDLKTLYAKSRSEGFGREVQRRIMVGAYVLSTGYYDAYYLKAQKVRSLIAKDFHEAFSHKCDVIVAPTAPNAPFKIGAKISDPLQMYLNDIFTIPVNLAGLPGMSVPCGFTSSGLPIGLQLIGKPWDEETLFKTASAYESATEWHSKRPATVR